eukprot:Skav222763  [mRNA]  locus=scaffold600:242741:246408:- [translate_table: standard]
MSASRGPLRGLPGPAVVALMSCGPDGFVDASEGQRLLRRTGLQDRCFFAGGVVLLNDGLADDDCVSVALRLGSTATTGFHGQVVEAEPAHYHAIPDPEPRFEVWVAVDACDEPSTGRGVPIWGPDQTVIGFVGWGERVIAQCLQGGFSARCPEGATNRGACHESANEAPLEACSS